MATSNEADTKRWWQQSWIVIILLIVFPPAGIALVWLSKWKTGGKITGTVLSGVWFMLLLVSSPDAPTELQVAEDTEGTSTTAIPEESEAQASSPQSNTETKTETGNQIGDVVETQGRAIKVLGVSTSDGLAADNQFAEPITGTIVLVSLEMTNTSNESGNFAFSSFTLVDSQGRKYDEITDMSYSIWREEQGFGSRSDDYFPGEVKEEIAAFRVAPDASGFVLEWKGQVINLN